MPSVTDAALRALREAGMPRAFEYVRDMGDGCGAVVQREMEDVIREALEQLEAAGFRLTAPPGAPT